MGAENIQTTPAFPLKLNLGCGFKKLDGYVNIDIRSICNPDIIGEVFEVLATYPDSTVDEIRAYDFLEHIYPDKVVPLLSEIWRVLKPDGVLDFAVPSTDSRAAYMDPTHVSFWNINTWLYFYDADWHALYPDWPFFNLLQLYDSETSRQLRIIHTYGKVSPKK